MDARIATINMAASSAPHKLAALAAFLDNNKIDVALLQEVAVPEFDLNGYSEVVNLGEHRRGTAILSRRHLTTGTLLPCGRGEAMGDLCGRPAGNAETMETLAEVKHAINAVHLERLRRFAAQAKVDSKVEGEPTTMHHVRRGTRRHHRQTIHRLTTDDGLVLDGPDAVAGHLLEVFTLKFSAPAHPPTLEAVLENVDPTIDETDNAVLDQDVTEEEVEAAVMAGRPRKSPGYDGIVAEFYVEMWPVIRVELTEVLAELWQSGKVPRAMLHGVMVLIPKKTHPATAKDLRPLTMLNQDLKIYTRMLTARMTLVQDKLLHPMQVRPGGQRNMAASLCDLRDAISQVHATRGSACVLGVDLAAAFDSVRHEYMVAVLEKRGVAPNFVRAAQSLYADAWTQLRVNGRLTGAFPVERSIRQGCPKGALYFAVGAAPLVFMLDRALQGVIQDGRRLAVSGYADDVYALLRSSSEAALVDSILEDFGAASGLQVNRQKSAALALGRWDTTESIGWAYKDNITVLGIRFASTVSKSVMLNWPGTVQAARGALVGNSGRALTVTQRVGFASVYALSRLWHVAQALPLPTKAVNEVNRDVARFVWRGWLFRAPIETITRGQLQGGLGLTNVGAKCVALLVGRWHSPLHLVPDGFSAAWLRARRAAVPVCNPPNLRAASTAAPHYRSYSEVGAYGGLPDEAADVQASRLSVYRALQANTEVTTQAPRVVAANPHTEWPQVWANVRSPVLPVDVQDMWYVAVHDLVATKVRLHRIGKDDGRGECRLCGVPDTLEHRLAECTGAAQVWALLQPTLSRLVGR
ncbi:hypothetical protein ONE63_011397 [Megalurothrips usitatus]|uniref:Reverse transcriptase domain-containing protein n=1 Tax=Megalurothrips usitatus TaxID=439358 RepID=A0AAV7X212_9NEOP|nr:hypothetical protein ONE63_011397 [Megalurothrips usitatus]